MQDSGLMAGSQYPQTTRSILKTGLLFYHKSIVFFQQKKSLYLSEIDQSFPSNDSFSYSENEFNVSLIQFETFRKIEN